MIEYRRLTSHDDNSSYLHDASEVCRTLIFIIRVATDGRLGSQIELFCSPTSWICDVGHVPHLSDPQAFIMCKTGISRFPSGIL